MPGQRGKAWSCGGGHCSGVRLLWGVSTPGGVCSRRVSVPVGCLVPGDAWPWGAGPGGGGIPASTKADTPVNRMTDRCKRITLPQTSFAGGKNKCVL